MKQGDYITLNHVSGAQAVVSLYGGQLLSWKTSDHQEQLFLSELAVFDGVTPIRGGVPVLFPVFGANSYMPSHGFARINWWGVKDIFQNIDYSRIVLALDHHGVSNHYGFDDFLLELEITLHAKAISLALSVTNIGVTEFQFQAGLHSYFRIENILRTTLSGLGGTKFSELGSTSVQSEDELFITGPIDRIYSHLPSSKELRLRDPARTLSITSNGFHDSVVWNPWSDGCRSMADMNLAGYQSMLCVESADVNNPIFLKPDDSYTATQMVSVLDRDR
ncbi:MAG: D-hexose-6-phosphate mutarotase [Gammaproteobacteria bacterium]|nr:D-hexose-6-phosphate mutarotase [Gammaproteobacteria bacterium]